MTETPDEIVRELIPVEYMQTGITLLVDRGQGDQLFQVEAVRYQSTQQDDGSYLTRYTITSGPPADGGDPWVLDLPAGSAVAAVYRKGRRPVALPRRG